MTSGVQFAGLQAGPTPYRIGFIGHVTNPVMHLGGGGTQFAGLHLGPMPNLGFQLVGHVGNPIAQVTGVGSAALVKLIKLTIKIVKIVTNAIIDFILSIFQKLNLQRGNYCSYIAQKLLYKANIIYRQQSVQILFSFFHDRFDSLVQRD